MTKNYEEERSSNQSENMAPSNPQSPQEQVMDFINTLGDHMEEAFAAASPNTEKGDNENAQQGPGNPPEYYPTEKGESSGSANRETQGRPEGDGARRANWGNGPWNNNWRDQQNPWAAMASMWSNPENLANGGPFGPNTPLGSFGPNIPLGSGGPFGHGGPFGGRGGRGGFGRGGHHGPWGWGGRRWGGHRGGCHRGNDGNNDQEFTPAIDIFDTPDSFVVHIALPGANKEDIGINYDFDNAELQVSGVVHRPGDEEFLKHLVDGERRVGAFDRKIKLESKGKTVAVDADAITAKMENGLLEVTVPKLRKADEPEKKKINIE